MLNNAKGCVAVLRAGGGVQDTRDHSAGIYRIQAVDSFGLVVAIGVFTDEKLAEMPIDFEGARRLAVIRDGLT